MGGGETGGTTVGRLTPFVTGGKNAIAGWEQIVKAAVPTRPTGNTLRIHSFHSEAMTESPAQFRCCG
jgi:hypothetical protein